MLGPFSTFCDCLSNIFLEFICLTNQHLHLVIMFPFCNSPLSFFSMPLLCRRNQFVLWNAEWFFSLLT